MENQNMPNNYFNATTEPKKGIPTWLGLLIIVVIAVVVGLGILGYQYSIQNQIPEESSIVYAITENFLKNATLSYPNPYDESKNDTIKLVDGHALISDDGGEKPRAYDVAKTAIGDLNNDGVAEGVIGIYQGYGANILGPVVFVFSDNNGVLKQIDAVSLPGETIDSEIKSLSINNGVLLLNLLVISENDLQNLPHSEWQPSVNKTFQYKLVDGKLVEQQPDLTADWKTYTNNEYGFEIKVPIQDYILHEASTEYNRNEYYDRLFAIDMGKLASVPAYFIGIKNNISSIDSLKEFMENLPGVNNENFENITISNKEAVKLIAKGVAEIPVLHWVGIVNNNIAYIISIGQAGNVQEYNKFLSTFKFTK